MSFLKKVVPNALKQKSPDMFADLNQYYNSKIKFGLIGIVSAGKSTVAAGMVYGCSLLSATDPNFFCHVQPNCKQILIDANNLRMGRFPKKTDPLQPNAPVQGIVLGEKGFKGKTAAIPIADVAGEITDYIEARADSATTYEQIQRYMQTVNVQVINLLQECTGIIVTLDATSALMFRNHYDSKDSDAYTHNVLNAFLQYRRNNHKPDPFIIAIITKWDQVAEMARAIQMNAYDTSQNGLDRFLANGFPFTHMLLKPLKDKGNVDYFTTWFKIKKRDNGEIETWEDGSPRINMLSKPGEYIASRPDASEEDLIKIVKRIASFAQ